MLRTKHTQLIGEQLGKNRVFADAVLAYSSMDAALHAPTRDADLLAWHVDYRKLPAEAYPNLAATVDHIPPLDAPDSFALLVDLLIAAIKARAEAH